MKLKAKLIATIMTMCLVVTLGVIGIFAVKTLNMNVGGNITFSADGLSLEVSAGEFKTEGGATYSNITTQSNKFQEFAIDTNTKLSDIQSKIDSWSNLELVLDSKGDAILHFSVTNKMATSLYVYVTTNLGTNLNNNMDLVVSPNGSEIASGVTTNVTITFDILDMNINAGLTGFEISIDFFKEKIINTQNRIDQSTGLPTQEVDYYYVEMGTYNGEPVRWRYIADVNGDRYDGISPVTTLRGYYILETPISTTKNFLSHAKINEETIKHKTEEYANIAANDYYLSDIREYLANTATGGFMEKLSITENDTIYSIIKSRTMLDLYKNVIGGSYITIEKTNQEYSLSLLDDNEITSNGDKFWLLSRYELETFFPESKSKIWGEGMSYWLRSPMGEGNVRDVHYVSDNGWLSGHYANDIDGVRPAFKIA